MSRERNIAIKTGVALTTSETTTAKISFGGFAGGGYRLTAGSATLVTFYGGFAEDDTFQPIYDRTPTTPVIISQVVAASRAFAFPPECFGFPYIKMLADAACTISYSLKT